MSEWSFEEAPADDYVAEPPTPLASLVYLTRELRRRWRTWVGLLLVGLCLGGLYSWHYPPKSVATVTLSLQHPAGSDTTAMQTDVAILNTRVVAGRTLAALGERMPLADFLKTYSGVPTTSSVLTVTVKADSPRGAVRTAETLASTYLTYRAQQERTSAAAQVAGVKNQIADLEQQLTAAEAQYQEFKDRPSGAQATTVALQQINTLRAQIGSMQTTVQSAQNATQAVIDSSVVLDPAAVVPASALEHRILTLFTGAVGGLGLGAAIVVVNALISTRLRRREDVALAAGAPVTHTVRRVRRARLARRPWLGRDRGACEEVQTLAHGIASVVDRPGVHRAALVTLGNERVGLATVAFAGARLSSDRRVVFLVDLSDSGTLDEQVRRAVGAAVRPSVAPTVHRPDGPPAFAQGPLTESHLGGGALGPHDPARARWKAADVVIAVAPVSFDVGLDHLAGWADTAVLLVTAGRSTAEEVSTAAGLLRSAGLDVAAVLLVGTDRTDRSFGRRESVPEAAEGLTSGRRVES